MALFYIRFLKPPPQTCEIGRPFTIVWTIESDLGDCTYTQPVQVQAALNQPDSRDLQLEVVPDKAKPGSIRRVESKALTKANVELMFDPYRHGGMVTQLVLRGRAAPSAEIQLMLKLAVSAQQGAGHRVWSEAYRHNVQGDPAWVIPIWSAPLNITAKQSLLHASGHEVERIFTTTDGLRVRIREEVAESIARHVWDCGLGMCDYLARLVANQTVDFKHDSIIELGSGTGLVGLYAASLLQPKQVFLTDLPEALEIMDQNARLQHGSSDVIVKPLEWGPKQADAYHWLSAPDLVLLTDVLYNQASHDILLATLDWLVPSSADTQVLLAYKQRNQDERVFFEKLTRAHWEHERVHDPALTCEMYWLRKIKKMNVF